MATKKGQKYLEDSKVYNYSIGWPPDISQDVMDQHQQHHNHSWDPHLRYFEICGLNQQFFIYSYIYVSRIERQLAVLTICQEEDQ